MLQLLRNLRHHSQGKEIGDADILKWANEKVKKSGRSSQMESFKVNAEDLDHAVCLYVCYYTSVLILVLSG